jgi:hypothetical protein
MRKTKAGVIIHHGNKLDMYEFARFRTVNKLSRPQDVSIVNVKRFLKQRATGGACALCGSDVSVKSGLCLRGCVASSPRR